MTEKESNLAAVQDYYPEDFSWCYGCGRLNVQGHHFRTRWNHNETVTAYEPQPEHIAIPGFVYGGLLASLVDCHSTGSAALALYRQAGHELGDLAPIPRCVTASLKVDYRKPTPLGVLLIAHGQIVETRARKVIVHTEVYAADALCVHAEAILVIAPASMTTRVE